MIDVMVVDDNPIVREALSGYLATAEDVRVVALAGDGRQAHIAARQFRPTVCLLDYRMPVADGLSVIEALAQYTKVLVITGDGSRRVIESMLRGGAHGYLVHGHFDPPELLHAVRAVAAGQGWLSPVAAWVAASAVREHAIQERESRELAERNRLARTRLGLTEREHDVLELLCQGMSNAAIADRLLLTEKTVKNHLNHAYAKLQVGSRTEAVLKWRG
jgi:DNA-binding NarL/FixJ family response regulator